MAKGLRSKSKRKNRSLLRATVMDPVFHKQQKALSDSLVKSVQEKSTNSSLLALKKVLPQSASGAVVASSSQKKEKKSSKVEEDVMEENSSDDDEEEEGGGKKKTNGGKKTYSSVTGLKESVRGKAFKSSRRQTKISKELVWFK
eukprot:gene3754-4105_t